MSNRKISPDICAYYDEDEEKLKIEVELPGVKKKDITFKLNEDGFFIRASKEDYEYVGSYAVCCPVIPKKAEAKYSDGLLTVTVPYKEPFEEAVNVEIK
jgi:HSP20 family molecular chaperone IbpA